MSYGSVYGCGGTLPVHTCHDCPESRVVEFAGVRSAGFIRKKYLATLLSAPTTAATWTDGITSGDVIIMPSTYGSYDPGEPKELKGFGNRKTTYGMRTMKVTFNDPDYLDNYHFYNDLSQRTDLVPFFNTSSQIRIFDKAAFTKAKDPVVEDIEEQITWLVESTVISANLPRLVPITGLEDVFTCQTS
jgi:hypothetical protein